MLRTIAESEKLYEQIKTFFLNEEKAKFVIEISDSPLADWNIVNVHSDEEMMEVRGQLMDTGGTDFAGFIYFEGHYSFYYVDHNFAKCEYTDSGKIVAFHDYKPNTFDLAKVAEELRLLQGS